jgi:hypothetical protein
MDERNFTRREQQRLRGIDAALCGSDPQLAAIMAMFGRLYRGEAMPAWEHQPRPGGRLRRSAAWVVAALADAAPADCRFQAPAPDVHPEPADGGPRPDGQP